MDRARIVTFKKSGQPQVVMNLNDGVNYTFIRDHFKFVPPEKQQQFTTPSRRFGGARLVRETHDNAKLELGWIIDGSDADDCLRKWEDLLIQLDDVSVGRYLEWRPDGATRSSYFELRGSTDLEPIYRWIVFSQTHRIELNTTVAIAPLAEGDRLTISETFADSASFDEYTVTGTGYTPNPVTGLSFSDTTQRTFRHSGRGYRIGDSQQYVGFKLDSNAFGATFQLRILLKWIDASNYIFADYVNGTGLRLGKVDNGAETLFTPTGTNAFTNNTFASYWLEGRVEGNVLFAHQWASPPNLGYAQPSGSIRYVLLGADATKFGSQVQGDTGFSVTPGSTGWHITEYVRKPYAYRNVLTPDTVRLRAIPGTAPAKANIIAQNSLTPPPPFALFGWTPSPDHPVNLLEQGAGDLGTYTTKWSGAARTSFNAAATATPTQVQNVSVSQYREGQAGTEGSLKLSTTAVVDSGTSMAVAGRFRAGRTYTFSAWVMNSLGVGGLRLKIGSPSEVATIGQSADVATTTGWQKITTSFTPLNDQEDVVVAVTQSVAVASSNYYVDAMMVYEGTTEPTRSSQQWGYHALVPFGVIEAEKFEASDQRLAPISDATKARGKNKLSVGSSSYPSAGFWMQFDPSVLTPDEFTLGEVNLEIWMRYKHHYQTKNLRAVGYWLPSSGGSGWRYSAEWGAIGRSLDTPSGAPGTGVDYWRFCSLGTFTLPVDKQRPARWRFLVDFAWGTGSLGSIDVDYLIVVPTQSKAQTPTGKIYDPYYYPEFMYKNSASGYWQKRINTDLSGELSYEFNAPARHSGLGGNLLEFPPGDVDVLSKFSNVVPDDPSDIDSEESLTYPMGIHFDLIPRYRMARTTT